MRLYRPVRPLHRHSCIRQAACSCQRRTGELFHSSQLKFVRALKLGVSNTPEDCSCLRMVYYRSDSKCMTPDTIAHLKSPFHVDLRLFCSIAQRSTYRVLIPSIHTMCLFSVVASQCLQPPSAYEKVPHSDEASSDSKQISRDRVFCQVRDEQTISSRLVTCQLATYPSSNA